MATRKRKSKAKPRPRRRRRKSGTPRRVKVLAALLVVVVVAGVLWVRYLKSPEGRVFLTDQGVVQYHAQVQGDLDEALHDVFEVFALLERLSETTEYAVVEGERIPVRNWEIRCDKYCSLVRINLAMTRAVESAGAVVRSGEERDKGALIDVELGTNRFPTHRIRVVSELDDPIVADSHEPNPRVALVIDDFGYTRGELIDEFLELDFPVTIAIIPTLRHSAWTAERARKHDKQVILHLPMEAEAHGSDVQWISTDMDRYEVARLLNRYLDESPGINGVNNHLGSRATQDPAVMEAVLTVLKRKDLFFLDSLTSPKSIAYTSARSLGVPTARNDIFLDAGTDEEEVVEERVYRLIMLAKQKGSAIGIGHPREWTLEGIKSAEHMLKRSGVEVVFVSELVN